jgi:hypothetical protein
MSAQPYFTGMVDLREGQFDRETEAAAAQLARIKTVTAQPTFVRLMFKFPTCIQNWP